MLTLQLFSTGGKARLVVGCALPGGLLPGRCGAIGHNLFPAMRPHTPPAGGREGLSGGVCGTACGLQRHKCEN